MYESNVVDAGSWQFKRFIVGIFGYESDGIVGATRAYFFYERALIGVKDIYFPPLEENIGQRQILASDEVSTIITRDHRVSAYRDKEIGIFQSLDKETFKAVAILAMLSMVAFFSPRSI